MPDDEAYEVVRAEQAPAAQEETYPAVPSDAAFVDAVTIEQPQDDLTAGASWVGLGLRGLAYVLAIIGCIVLVSADFRYETAQLRQGLPFLIGGLLVWLAAEGLTVRNQQDHDFKMIDAPVALHVKPAPATRDEFYTMLFIRLSLGVLAFILAYIAWIDTAARDGEINQFRPLGLWAWLTSILAITLAFVPTSWNPAVIIAKLRRRTAGLRFGWTAAALMVIVLVGAYFRLHNLDAVPPEMTSDHIEKILDSQRVAEGARDVFFANNGGREPLQMYAMALLSRLPGLGMNFTTLKLLAVIEGLVTLPVLWWMGREVMGEERRGLGNIVGLSLAALVAVSYWHVTITRLALRIVLMPLVTALLMIFLSRGMRENRRGDFVLTGLILGFGFYTYQAARMLPLVVVAGVLLAIVFYIQRRREVLKYLLHLGVVILISFIMFVPMLRYSFDYPDQFWMRTSGRLFGDDVIIEVRENGDRIPRDPTVQERLDAFNANLPVLANNIRNALLMFHWKGDVAWINGLPNHPAFDPLTGALLIVGLGAWLALMLRRPDPVFVLVPLIVLIMILPSALSIAAPLENPSATRTSGSLPPVYLLAALPLAMVIVMLRRVISVRGLRLAVPVLLAMVIVSGAFAINSQTYFDRYRESYVRSWASHSVPGDLLRAFATGEGRYGNAFIVGYEYWLDHRIVGIEAGVLDWSNAVADPNNRKTGIGAVPDFLNDAWRCPINAAYALDPERPLLIFFKGQDEEARSLLTSWFPDGVLTEIGVEREGDDFYTYRVPAPGAEQFAAWLEDYARNPRC
jgi:hypothetical protein